MSTRLLHRLLIRTILVNGLSLLGIGVLILFLSSAVSRGFVYGLAVVMLIDSFHTLADNLKSARRWKLTHQLFSGMLSAGGGILLIFNPTVSQRNLTIIALAMSIIIGSYRLTSAFVLDRKSMNEVVNGVTLIIVGAIGLLTFPYCEIFFLGLVVGLLLVKKGVSILLFLPSAIELHTFHLVRRFKYAKYIRRKF